MIGHDDDLLVRQLRGLSVVEPDATRTERARQRCHAALAARQPRRASSGANGRFRTAGLGAIVTLVAGLVVGMIHDVLRVYLRL